MVTVAAAHAPPDALSMPPAVMAVVAPAPVIAAVVDQFDLGFAVTSRGIGCRGFQFIQDTARVGHAGNGVDRPDSRGNSGCSGKTQNAGKECSPIHRDLQSKSAPREPSSRQ
jgi:hypothetical protein